MMKQYSEQFLQKFPDVHGFEVKPTHISPAVSKREVGHKFQELVILCIYTCGKKKKKKTNPETLISPT